MTKRLEILSKLIPAITILCYGCGFLVFNTHLWHFGIVDIQIFNLQYIVAGLHYLLLAALVLGINLYLLKLLPKKIWNTVIYLLIFSAMLSGLYTGALYSNDTFKSWLIFGIALFVYTLITYIYLDDAFEKKLIFTDFMYFFFVFGLGSVMIFGHNYRFIKRNYGGGELYKKVLILEKPVADIIPSNKSDTLYIIHENDQEIFFLNKNKVCGIKKSLVIGQFLIK